MLRLRFCTNTHCLPGLSCLRCRALCFSCSEYACSRRWHCFVFEFQLCSVSDVNVCHFANKWTVQLFANFSSHHSEHPGNGIKIKNFHIMRILLWVNRFIFVICSHFDHPSDFLKSKFVQPGKNHTSIDAWIAESYRYYISVLHFITLYPCYSNRQRRYRLNEYAKWQTSFEMNCLTCKQFTDKKKWLCSWVSAREVYCSNINIVNFTKFTVAEWNMYNSMLNRIFIVLTRNFLYFEQPLKIKRRL